MLGLNSSRKKPTVFCGLECVGRKSNWGSHTGLGGTKYKLKFLKIVQKLLSAYMNTRNGEK
jgi:hypothetical protein